MNPTPHSDRPPMVYMLHSGNLFGTERMALETLAAFPDYRPVILCPPGPLVEVARSRGIETWIVRGGKDLVPVVYGLLRYNRRLAVMSTTLTQVLCLTVLNLIFRRDIAHLHLVHGGADERSSYGRKKFMNRFALKQVAVSEFVRERLIHYGVRPDKIAVVGNFLSTETIAAIPRHTPFTAPLRPRGVVVSRLIPDKRVHLLCEAMEQVPDLCQVQIDVFGVGGQLEPLRDRAKKANLPLQFRGFAADVQQRLQDYDFLVHLNPEEPFGMVILEAMAAGIPVLVPNRGGAATIVQNDINGFTFQADDAGDLASTLLRILRMDPTTLQQIIVAADQSLADTFSQHRQVAAYRHLLER